MSYSDKFINAHLRDCKMYNGVFGGVVCTNSCEYFDSCRVQRVPFLIQTRNFKVKYDKQYVCNGSYVSQYNISSSEMDGYINELTSSRV